MTQNVYFITWQVLCWKKLCNLAGCTFIICISNSSRGWHLGSARCLLNTPRHPIITKKKVYKAPLAMQWYKSNKILKVFGVTKISLFCRFANFTFIIKFYKKESLQQKVKKWNSKAFLVLLALFLCNGNSWRTNIDTDGVYCAIPVRWFCIKSPKEANRMCKNYWVGQLYDIKQIFHRHALDMRQAGACCAIIISYPNKHEWDTGFIKTPKYR